MDFQNGVASSVCLFFLTMWNYLILSLW